MRKSSSLFLVCFIMLVSFVCLVPAQAAAEQKIEWNTTDLYYEVNEDGTPENILIIEGYFVNNTDRYINYIYELTLTATITNERGYTDNVTCTFRDFEKMIEPYSASSDHRFRIRNAEIIWPVESYDVQRGYIKWKHSGAAG